MKKLFLVLIVFSISQSIFAKNMTTTETLFTCQEEDGDQWLEVGIALNDGPGLVALVVQHNDDDQSAKLIAHRLVSALPNNGDLVYEDADGTIRVSIKKKPRSITAGLALLQDGPNSISVNRLGCTENSTISFQK